MGELQLTNTGVTQVCKVRANGWTMARRAIFLDVLAMTCNVARACAAAGMQRQSHYKLRRRDPAFDALYVEALARGKDRVEEMLYARALGEDGDDDNPSDERVEVDGVGFDQDLAVKLMSLRKDPGKPQPQMVAAVALATIDRELIRRLDMIARRLGNHT